MTELVRIAEFGQAGMNADRQPTLLQPGEWTLLDNIDLESGDIRSAWGDSLLVQNPPITPLYTFVFEGADDTYFVIADGSGGIYQYNGSVWEDIAPYDALVTDPAWNDGGNVGDGTWDGNDFTIDQAEASGGGSNLLPFGGRVSFTTFLGILIVCPSEGVPAYWPNETGRMEPLPGWNVSWRAQSMVAYENHLVALGLDDGAIAGAKYRVAWSDAAVEGTVPQEWQATTTNLAGSVQLRDTDGFLVVGVVLRNSLIIYKNDSIYRMFLTGTELVMGFERVIEGRGCDSFRGVAPLDGRHFFADRGDVLVFDGQGVQSIASMRVQESLAAALSNEYRDATQTIAYSERDEIWVAVVPAGLVEISAVLVYSIEHDSWSLKRYPGAISMCVGPFAVLPGGSVTTSWDLTPGSWDEQDDTWNASAFEPSEDSVIFGSTSQIWRADKSHTDQNEAPKFCRAERTGFLLQGISPRSTVKAIYPEFEVQGSPEVRIQIGAQWAIGDTIRWTPPQTFRPGLDRKINTRITGQPCAFRIESTTPGGWRLAALSLGVTPASGR